jgi:LysM repeat protein
VTQEEFSAVCPYLGLADDADSHATYATEAHRCYRLTNPTRIASPHQETYCLGANHVSCPVYLGEGVPQTQRPATGAAAAGAATAAAGAAAVTEEAPVRGPRAGQRPRPATEPRPKRPAGGTLGPRPRSGGISMPVATIGLFALALVVIGLAFAIQQLVGDGGDEQISPADSVATKDALNKTKTSTAGGNQTQPAQTQTTQQPGSSQTPNGSQTATGSRTTTPGTGTPGAGGKTYTVKSGDFCGTIAQDQGVTLQALLDANKMTEDDCTRLSIGQTLKIP